MRNSVRGESIAENGEAALSSLHQPWVQTSSMPVDSGVPSGAAPQTEEHVNKSRPRWTVIFNTLSDVGWREWRRWRPSRRTMHRLDWIAWFACMAAILGLLMYVWEY